METNMGSIPAYFVGNHYEVSGSSVKKYYYAGSQRIAMNADGLTYFLIGDHLGSTSLTTDANGVLASEMKYTAWGEVRDSAGTMPTNYTYTGQYSHVNDFGLLYYNARWYDPSLGRFAQADTIVPGGVQGYDRYAYTNNNPVKYTDPSGHAAENEDGGGCLICIQPTTPTPTPTTPLAVVVGGSYGGGSWQKGGPDPMLQLPAYTSNPFGYDQQYVRFTEAGSDSRYAFAKMLDSDLPNRPILFVCYSATAPSCLMAAAMRIDAGQSVAGVLIIGGTFAGDDKDGNAVQFGQHIPPGATVGPPGGYDVYADKIYNAGISLLIVDDNSGTAGGARGKPYYQDPINPLRTDGVGLEHYLDKKDDGYYGTQGAALNTNTFLQQAVYNYYANYATQGTGAWVWPPK
jgi:RHS repeat-associated protein